MGLFLALASRHVLVTQMLLAVGQRGERQVGSECRVFWRGGTWPSPGPGVPDTWPQVCFLVAWPPLAGPISHFQSVIQCFPP